MKYNINTAHTIARFGKVVNIFCGDKSKPSPKSSSKKLWKRQGPFDTGFTGQKSTNPFRLKPSLGVFSCNLGYRKLVAKKKESFWVNKGVWQTNRWTDKQTDNSRSSVCECDKNCNQRHSETHTTLLQGAVRLQTVLVPHQWKEFQHQSELHQTVNNSSAQKRSLWLPPDDIHLKITTQPDHC